MATIKKGLKKAKDGVRSTPPSTSTHVPKQDKGLYDKVTKSGIQTKNEGNKKVSTLKSTYTKSGYPVASQNVRRMDNANAKVNDTISSFRNKRDISDRSFNAPTNTSRYSIKRPGGVENVNSTTFRIGGIDQTKSAKTFTKDKKNGGPVKKKMKNGGSLSGLKASNKRVGPVDPKGKGKKGAFTEVQKNALKGAKTTASLTKNKQLGATKMAKSGAKMSKGKKC